MPCSLCGGSAETLNPRVAVYPPENHTADRLLEILTSLERPFGHQEYGALLFPTELIRRHNSRLVEELSTPQLTDTIAVDITGDAPTPSEVRRTRSFGSLLDEIQGEWLVDLLNENGLYCLAQPIVDRDGSVFGHEMLMRGKGEGGAVITPYRMLRAASTPELRAKLDRAARIAAVHSGSGISTESNVFINFLPSSVYDPQFCLETTFSAARAAKIDPSRLVFEVVETDKISDFDHLAAIIARYREEGFAIALDDFGTGFNNIETVIRLRPEYIKLDKLLVTDSIHDKLKTQFIHDLASVAQMNGIKTIAEGIEDQETLDHVLNLGVDFFQGYHLGRPG
ncbi:EAL domain-containing protein [Hwanghaeella grinnelliae]|uniref:EAL domain-containing protein n=1 Tax=Hwanghaeella grinnelliae TaxID=2500179 RepID=A0A3S3UNS1_9PROT|nr:EAL domain-containing protein [Hwanghaeella grinnelliae]RVU36332.1 EAL domain-containing protein [Hwanghaeella grinnelliae]